MLGRYSFGRTLKSSVLKAGLIGLPFSYNYSKIDLKFIGVLFIVPERGKL